MRDSFAGSGIAAGASVNAWRPRVVDPRPVAFSCQPVRSGCDAAQYPDRMRRTIHAPTRRVRHG